MTFRGEQFSNKCELFLHLLNLAMYVRELYNRISGRVIKKLRLTEVLWKFDAFVKITENIEESLYSPI